MAKTSDLDRKRRVGVIRSGHVASDLSFLSGALLFVAAVAGLTVPVTIGAATSSAKPQVLMLSKTQATDTVEYNKFVAEVVSIKRSNLNNNFDSWGMPPGSDTFSARNVTVLRILREAYAFGHGTEDNRVIGGPSWLNTDRYDMDAKLDPSLSDAIQKLPIDKRTKAIQHILLAMLADRCKLVVHLDTRELAIYALVIAKGGPKLKGAAPDELVPPTDPNADPRRGPGVWMVGRSGPMVGKAVTTTDVANMLQYLLNRTVVDKTGLTGKYTFTLQWEQDENASSEDAEASFLKAFPDQLGLKLESGKGPVEVIVIDRIERPSGN